MSGKRGPHVMAITSTGGEGSPVQLARRAFSKGKDTVFCQNTVERRNISLEFNISSGVLPRFVLKKGAKNLTGGAGQKSKVQN